MITPFSRPLYVMLKPAGSSCNMACRYCYYTEKAALYRHEQHHMMSDALLEEFTRQYMESQTQLEAQFTWHGGEPLLRPLSFYKRAVELQRRYAEGRHVENCLQTNGTLLTDEWCEFLSENHWLVGISIDGPEDLHDAYRRMRGGEPSFKRVMAGVELLQKHGVEWNAMAVVNRLNVDRPLDFYRFFKGIGCQYLQFTPIVERVLADGSLASIHDEEAALAPYSVSPEQWGRFLCAVYDEWLANDVGRVFVQLFESTLCNWVGRPPGVCTMGRSCGHAAVMEFNGDVYACDHFVFPEYKLGNIRQQTLTEMLYSPRQQQFGRMKTDALPGQCHRCEWLFLCHGECPKNRFCRTADGEPGLNYLCQGYRQFFTHAAPSMKQLLTINYEL